jgi:hypothetical protein
VFVVCAVRWRRTDAPPAAHGLKQQLIHAFFKILLIYDLLSFFFVLSGLYFNHIFPFFITLALLLVQRRFFVKSRREGGRGRNFPRPAIKYRLTVAFSAALWYHRDISGGSRAAGTVLVRVVTEDDIDGRKQDHRRHDRALRA